MAKLFPSKQTVVDHLGTTTFIISDVTIVNSTSDHLELPNADDASILATAADVSDPTFYLTTSGNEFAIDGATIGTKYTVVSRHDNGINAARGKNIRGNNNVL